MKSVRTPEDDAAIRRFAEQYYAEWLAFAERNECAYEQDRDQGATASSGVHGRYGHRRRVLAGLWAHVEDLAVPEEPNR